MNNFFIDHSLDAFGCMSNILSEHFSFKLKGQKEVGVVTMGLNYFKCDQNHTLILWTFNVVSHLSI